MPKISEFFGISIYVYYREHFPAHFHALYGGHELKAVWEQAMRHEPLRPIEPLK